jgi:hypothetical protein
LLEKVIHLGHLGLFTLNNLEFLHFLLRYNAWSQLDLWLGLGHHRVISFPVLVQNNQFLAQALDIGFFQLVDECLLAECLRKALKCGVLRVRLHFLGLLQALIHVKTLLLFIHRRLLLLDINLLSKAILLHFKVTENSLFLCLVLLIPQIFQVYQSGIFLLRVISLPHDILELLNIIIFENALFFLLGSKWIAILLVAAWRQLFNLRQ